MWYPNNNRINSKLLSLFICSLSYLLENTENKSGQFPLLEAKLILKNEDLLLNPSAEDIKAMGSSLVGDIFHISSLVPRLVMSNRESSTYEVQYFCI